MAMVDGVQMQLIWISKQGSTPDYQFQKKNAGSTRQVEPDTGLESLGGGRVRGGKDP
jgi:hypothetical protein